VVFSQISQMITENLRVIWKHLRKRVLLLQPETCNLLTPWGIGFSHGFDRGSQKIYVWYGNIFANEFYSCKL